MPGPADSEKALLESKSACYIFSLFYMAQKWTLVNQSYMSVSNMIFSDGMGAKDSNSCRTEKTEKTVKSEKTWIVQRLAPLREQRADGSLDVPSRGGTAKSAWDPPNLAGYLHQGPELKEENYLQVARQRQSRLAVVTIGVVL